MAKNEDKKKAKKASSKTGGTFHVITASAVDHEFHGTVELVDDHIEVSGDEEWHTWLDAFVTANTGETLHFESDAYHGDIAVVDENTIQTR